MGTVPQPQAPTFSRHKQEQKNAIRISQKKQESGSYVFSNSLTPLSCMEVKQLEVGSELYQ